MSTIFQRLRDLILSNRTDHAIKLVNLRAEREEAFNARHFCAHCKEASTDAFMVKNDVWAEAGMGKGFLHLVCLEDRIGRSLTSDDFPDYPINRPVLFGYIRGKLCGPTNTSD